MSKNNFKTKLLGLTALVPILGFAASPAQAVTLTKAVSTSTTNPTASILNGFTNIIDFEPTQIAPLNLPGITAGTVGPFPGRVVNSILTINGVEFGETFKGQTAGTNGNFETFTGNPSNPLEVVAGPSNENLALQRKIRGTQTLVGIGNQGFNRVPGHGEGLVAVDFNKSIRKFGFEVVGGNGGNIIATLYGTNATSLGSFNLGPLTDEFTSILFDASGGPAVGGYSLSYDPSPTPAIPNDFDGVFLDNVVYEEVPEPATILGSLAALGFGAYSRRRMKLAKSSENKVS